MKKTLLATALLLAAGSAFAEVVVQADGLSIEAAEIERAISEIIPPQQQPVVRDKADRLERFTRDYAQVRQLGNLAIARGLDQDPAVQLKLEQERNRVLTQALIEDELAKSGRPDAKQLAREIYVAEPQRFAVPEQVHTRHILFIQQDDETEVELKQRAGQVLAELRKDKSRFAELAKEHSQDPGTAEQGGDLGYLARDEVVAPYADAAFALKKGEISEPVKTRFGLHIIELLDKKPAGKRTFAEVEDLLIQEVEANYDTRVRGEIITRLRAQNELQLDEAALQRLHEKLKAEQAASDRAAKAAKAASDKKAGK